MGDERKLEGFLVPFGHRVGGMYIFGIYVSWLNICLYWLYHANTWEMNVIWRVSLCHSSTRLWECTFLEYVSVKYITLLWIYNANSWGMNVIWRVSLCPSGTELGEWPIFGICVSWQNICLYWIYIANYLGMKVSCTCSNC